jgi:SAM-dependent methyltransferase
MVSTASANAPPWVARLACPQCRSALDAAGIGLICPSCGRTYAAVARGYDLLPPGVSARHNEAAPTGRGLRQAFVGSVYTRHNRSRAVQGALRHVLGELKADGWGLNLGAADTDLHQRLLCLDVAVSPNVNLIATADRLPLLDGSMACVVSQEVFEHLPDPLAAACEVLRVLRPGGLFYLQVPFIIGFHSGPHDYWRFTHAGIAELLRRAGFETVEIGAAVGAGTSMYRIAVEFAATLAACVWRKLYMPAKGVAAILCAPLRLADLIAPRHSDTNRICAGFYAIARKPADGNPAV